MNTFFSALAAVSTLALAVVGVVGYFFTIEPWALNQRLDEEKSRLEIRVDNLTIERDAIENRLAVATNDLLQAKQERDGLEAAVQRLQEEKRIAEVVEFWAAPNINRTPPALLPLSSLNGLPTSMSSNPSPLTSPAPATLVPRLSNSLGTEATLGELTPTLVMG